MQASRIIGIIQESPERFLRIRARPVAVARMLACMSAFSDTKPRSSAIEKMIRDATAAQGIGFGRQGG